MDRLECATCGVAWVVKGWDGVAGGVQLNKEMRELYLPGG